MKKFVVFMLALLFILPINSVHAQREVTISLDGKTITADAKPYIKNDRTMVPIRLISESLGYKVNWDEANRQVKVEKADKSLLITIDKKELSLTAEQEKELRLEIAIMLYEKADYSFYVAAKLAGMHWMDFVKELGKRGLSIFDEESVLKDIEMAEKYAKNNS